MTFDHASATGVADATQDLYRDHGRQVYAYCLRKLRSREEAEDAVQTTFLNAFRSMQRGAIPEHEQAWLFRIAHNECLNRQSSSARRRQVESPNALHVLEDTFPARADADPVERMTLEEALDQMPPNQRRAIVLREWQGFSYREIADELQVSQNAVEMLIFRARRGLAASLGQDAAAQPRRPTAVGAPA